MSIHPTSLRDGPGRHLPVVTLILAVAIFAVDLLSSLDGAIAVLYIAVILLLAPWGRRLVVGAALATTTLTLIAFVPGHLAHPTEGALTRLAVSLIAIAITTMLSLRDRSTRTTLGEQARILELTHDIVIIRDPDDVIVYWNEGAEQLYGWTRYEAVGRPCQDLLQCKFPADEIAAALTEHGHWSGEVTRTRRDGTRLVLASRWLRRRDPDGHDVGVIESSADLTEKRHAADHMRASEQRYRTIFETGGFATWEADWSATMRIATAGMSEHETIRSRLNAHPEIVQAAFAAAVIRNANQSAATLFGVADREALIGMNLSGRYLPERASVLANILITLAEGGTMAEGEVSFRTLSGRVADVVLRATVLPEGEDWSHMLIMALDVTERNEARARLQQASAELAHASRVSILGQLAASIAHEVNQPLTAIINYGTSAKRWLGRSEPNLVEVQACVDKMVASGTRAADIVSRVRSLARKETPRLEGISLGELIDETITLVEREARAQAIVVRRRGRPDLPPARADRVQVQQVLVNLLMNGIHAMDGVIHPMRELCVETELMADGMVRVAVCDCGTGFPPGLETRIFEPFFSTKSDGMGMGLSICRSIIENQGGKISASNNNLVGATVSFTLPADVV